MTHAVTASPGHLPRVVCVTSLADPSFRWFAPELSDFDWDFFNHIPRGPLERRIRRPNLTRYRTAWQAVRFAQRHNARLLISFDPRTTALAALFAAQLGLRIPHISWSFNFTELPRGPSLHVMRHAFTRVDRFIVHSNLERSLYSDLFSLPIERFEFLYWGVGDPPADDTQPPAVLGPYVCSIGGNARDYPTLMAAMTLLPDVPLVAVMRPENLAGLSVPPNVRVYTNLPLATVHNIIRHSRFMALPLLGSDTPCGHVTLVSAMKFGRPFVISDSAGIRDYVADGQNALLCPPGDPHSLAQAIRSLWDDPARCDLMGRAGRAFADLHCSEAKVRDHLVALLRHYIPDSDRSSP